MRMFYVSPILCWLMGLPPDKVGSEMSKYSQALNVGKSKGAWVVIEELLQKRIIEVK